MKVLLVEDDILLGKALETGLKQAGYMPEWVRDGESAILSIDANKYNVVLLDINLPLLSGLQVLKKIRASAKTIPVIIMTARDSTEDKIEGLDLGADDYIIKPFELPELWARVRAVVRRSQGRANSNLICRDVEIDTAAKIVKKNNEWVKLTPKEYQVLVLLMEHAGKLMGKREIEEHLYAWNQEIESNTVEVTVYAIRKKLGKELITTMRGIGYMVSP